MNGTWADPPIAHSRTVIDGGAGAIRGLNRRQIWHPWLVAAIAALAVVAAFRAAFGAYFMLDDFGMLAISRFLSNPFEPFFREHIPGGTYYRPLGMLLWWVSERMLGTTAAAHYALNLALHLAVSGALYGLVTRLGAGRWTGLIATICFAAHPIGLGTTVWLSDRFDLLALLFGLLGFREAVGFAFSGNPRTLLGATALLALSLLAKEIGLSFLAATAAYWLFCATELRWRTRVAAIAVLVLLVATYWTARTGVLPGAHAEPLFALKAPARLFVDGMRNWFAGALDYLFYLPRTHGWKLLAAAVGWALLGFSAMVAATLPWNSARIRMVLGGAAVVFSAALLQWPLLGFNALPFEAESAALDVVVNSRFFYTAAAGFLVCACGVFKGFSNRWPGATWVVPTAVAILVPAWLGSGQHLVRQYRNETLTQRALVEQAVTRIGALGVHDADCQIYLLDTGDWRFGWVSDEAIKATIPDLDAIDACLIQTEHTPWYHIVSAESPTPQGWLPLTSARGFETQETRPPIGRGRFLALNLGTDSRPSRDAHAYYLRWRDDRFVDVSEDVREGRLVPAFHCNRRPAQCP